MLFPETEDRVENQEGSDDDQISPMMRHGGQNGCNFDHPGDGTPEIAQELEEGVGLFFHQGIGAVLGKTLFALGRAQALGTAGQEGKKILGTFVFGLITGDNG